MSHVGYCHYCDCKVFPQSSAEYRKDKWCLATKDHITPQSFGGRYTRTLLACSGCNNIRGNVHVEIFEYFMAEVGRGIPFVKERRIKWQEFLALIQHVGFITARKDAERRRIKYPAPRSIGDIVRRLAA